MNNFVFLVEIATIGMKLLPIGIQDFAKLRELEALYVDKTRYIYDLHQGSGYYFLSRPRRFGKSLLISTLKELFLGNKEIFEGLWIEHRIDWQTHPIIHISFNAIGYRELGLEAAIVQILEVHARAYQLELVETGIGLRFAELLRKLAAKGRRVVILIDEYDKPIIDYLEDIPTAVAQREILKSFYSIIKNADGYIRFLLITGVSKFSRVSIFSDLNNLEDLTMAPDFDAIAGYTQAELEQYFHPYIEKVADKIALSRADTLSKIKEWYNGYSWGGEHKLYNPFSILNLFKQKRFANFWFQTGTPTFLIKILTSGMHFELEGIEVGETLFESYDLQNLEYRALLFQTGYLTVKAVKEGGESYVLDYPNKEVRASLYQHLLGGFRHASSLDTQPLFTNLKRSLEANQIQAFIGHINTLFAHIPHQIFIKDQEAFFHAILHIAFKAIGMYVDSEVSRAKGRLDSIVQTEKYIYIMEFKLNESVAAALTQIRSQRYGSSYLGQNKEVFALGINFSSELKEVESWEMIDYEELLVG